MFSMHQRSPVHSNIKKKKSSCLWTNIYREEICSLVPYKGCKTKLVLYIFSLCLFPLVPCIMYKDYGCANIKTFKFKSNNT